MKEFIKHFNRESSGIWTCISKAEFNGPTGRIQVAVGSVLRRGMNFMGVDLAKKLEEQYKKNRKG